MDIEELKELAKAATPMIGKACSYFEEHWYREGHVDFENADLFIASERPKEDSEYYASVSPSVILELIAEIERLRARLASPVATLPQGEQYNHRDEAARIDIARLKTSLESGVIKAPSGMSTEEKVKFIITSTLSEQIKHAQAEYDSWTEEKRASVHLEGGK